MDLLRIVIAILLPPLGVFLQVGIGGLASSLLRRARTCCVAPRAEIRPSANPLSLSPLLITTAAPYEDRSASLGIIASFGPGASPRR